MVAKSYHAVGIQEILTTVDVPKGSFYHYFESKEAFGIAIIEYYGEQLAKSIAEKLANEKGSPREKIQKYFLGIRDYYAIHGCGRGCLVAKLAIEVENPSAAMGDALKREFDKWTALFASCIREGQKMGEISLEYDAESMAEFLYTSWEGALIRMQVNRDLAPIDKFIEHSFDRIIPRQKHVVN
ncbi:transcriptional regulator, TetR family [Pelosinus fermentans DSM 17108]|uniref:Regulatory protein TetR n=3 Tax=Sporomusaceae TaxID=1843490 RepID=I9B5I1_9FIRM|nr:regulatory protein TetR [Pelosinus fermentans B4]EIW25574.1 transcriptional regulator, TetR family [Pelosinus fermentans A11]OAM93296.1 transcriptional regulator, TetR family [Pelosinus fermentans DSM 17108]